MKKARIIIAEYSGRVAPLLDRASTFLVLPEDSETPQRYQSETVGYAALCRLFLSYEPQLVICSALSRRLEFELIRAGISLRSGIVGETAMVIDAWRSGTLDDERFRMPGCPRGCGGWRHRQRVCPINMITGEINMRIAVTIDGDNPADQIDPRFGRAKGFVVFDGSADKWEFVENTVNLFAVQGAGLQTAAAIAKCNVQAVITANVGPKAFAALNAAGINIYLCQDCSAIEALQRWQDGTLEKVSQANVEGHW